MTLPLERLAAAATQGRWRYHIQSESATWNDFDLCEYLANHRQDFIALVKAAEKMQRHNGSCQRAMEQSGMNEAIKPFTEEESP